ncbi:hypothetical protein BGZ60DRAFT_521691 [Tricladium varicosporioides]|nr:hypothetical protein BGZ60DRAFT_521691 [Hymenoscyphus varicosporioides]
MPSRLVHSKSRNGCVKCKASRVKCDETKPSCSRCLRRQDSCYYKDALLISNPISSPSSSVPSPQPPAHWTAAPRIPKDFWNDLFPHNVPNYSKTEQVGAGNFCDRDLELLHHYSTSTYLTLATTSSLEAFWQVVMVQIAFSNTFLMHGLLALSACHLTHLRTGASKHYSNLAMYHYTAAISLFRPFLDNINRQMAVPAIAFSTLIGCLSFAIPQVFQHPLEPHSAGPALVKNLLNIFRLVRGVGSVLASTSQWARDSPMAPLLTLQMEDAEVPLEFNAEIAVREVEAKIRLEIPSEEQKLNYLTATTLFRQCFPRGSFKPEHQSLISAWPVMAQDTFFAEMLEMKVGFPLVIMGYYGALMHFMSSGHFVCHFSATLQQLLSVLTIPSRNFYYLIYCRIRCRLIHATMTGDDSNNGIYLYKPNRVVYIAAAILSSASMFYDLFLMIHKNTCLYGDLVIGSMS